MSIDAAYLRELQEEAEAAGKRCVAGGLVLDERGRVFVQKRATGRRLFPGCLDIVGGHVEPGESLYGALEREIREETGWQLRSIVSLLHTFDWSEEERGPQASTRRGSRLSRSKHQVHLRLLRIGLRIVLRHQRFVPWCRHSNVNVRWARAVGGREMALEAVAALFVRR